jgi:D-alanyl-D-alanine carboxypeptidase
MNERHAVLRQIAEASAKKLGNLQIRIEHAGLDEPFVFSTSVPDQVFHSASVGKLATTVAIVLAIEAGLLDWTTPIAPRFPKHALDGLFVFQGKDHQDEVTVAHLLGHTSGINDYFEGKSSPQKPLIRQAVEQPDRRFRVDEMIDFTRNCQKAVGVPGGRFYYSDTGFLLLGRLAEAVWGQPLHRIFREQVFDPLAMNDTGLCFEDPAFDKDKLAPLFVRKTELSKAASLSVDWAGGGLYTTTADLTKLVKGIADGSLLSKSSLERMSHFKHGFRAGMYYGLGLMEMRFEKLFFLLKGLPRLIGHTGILGVHAWIDPATRDTYVINVGDVDKIAGSFQLLIQIVATLMRPTTPKIR